jgi:hypothetical protein
VTDPRPTRGDALDELIQNPRRLGAAHACLGLAAAFVYWIRPGTFTPHPVKYNFRDVGPIYMTFIAWIPYVIAFAVSRAILANRSPRASLTYIFLASAITVGASGLYLNLFRTHTRISPVLLAGGITITLLLAAGLCTTIWRSDGFAG